MSVTLSDTSPAFEQLDGLVELRSTRLVVVSLSSCDSAADVTEAATELVRRFRQDAAAGVLTRARSVVVLVPPSGSDPSFRAAVVQALRGIVQSVTREFSHRSQAINLLVVDSDRLDSAAPTLRYLDDPDGGYTAGFTFDISSTEVSTDTATTEALA